MSAREAREATKVAEVIAIVAGAEDALANGDVTAAHLAALAPIANTSDAADLLALAAGQSPEDSPKPCNASASRATARPGQKSNKPRGPSSSSTTNTAVSVCARYFHRWPVPSSNINSNRSPTTRGAPLIPNERRRWAGTMQSPTIDDSPTHSSVWRTAPVRSPIDEPPTPSPAEQTGLPSSLLSTPTLEAEIVGHGPIPFPEAADLAARADLFAAIRTTNGAILKFGRNRRLASPLQRLALIVRDGGCSWTGCTVDYTRCDADHDPPWEQGGTTDLEYLRLMCRCGHHSHLHETGQNIRRRVDGTTEIIAANGSPADAPARPAFIRDHNDHDDSHDDHDNHDDHVDHDDSHDDHGESIIWCADPPSWNNNDDGTDELPRLEDWANWERSFGMHETYSRSV